MLICRACGEANPEASSYCRSCSERLVDTAPALRKERKFAVALFADIVGSTSLGEELDPEVVENLIGRTLNRLRTKAEDFGGTIERTMGDGILVLFGIPRAHEDDAERAVRAALEMQASLAELNSELKEQGKPLLQIRIGIEGGEMLVGVSAEPTDRLLTGDAINTAARLQSSAEPGTVLVGEGIHSSTEQVIDYAPPVTLELAGKARLVPAWRARTIRARIPQERPLTRFHSPMIGRDGELSVLKQLLARCEEQRRPALITVLGSAGVGKTRLAHELRDFLDSSEGRFYWRRGRTLPYGGGPYSAFADAIKSHCEIFEDDPPSVVEEKVGKAVGELFGDDSVRDELLILVRQSGEQSFSRERLFDAWRRFLERMAARYPLVLTLEDVHWADDGLLDLIEYLADWSTGPILILTLARPELVERRETWGGGKRRYTALYLDPLTESQSEDMLDRLLDQPLPQKLRGSIIDRSEGNPLFTEEMVRMLIDRGVLQRDEDRWVLAGSIDDTALPRSIQSLITTRLDSLNAEEKAVVQDAAVIGRTFWSGTLEHMDETPLNNVIALLDRLRLKELVVEREPSSFTTDREFAFKHALIRDVAYDSLPKSLRARKHAQVAAWTQERVAARSEDWAEFIATHYLQALTYLRDLGGTDQQNDYEREAFTWSVVAGQRAARLWLNREAARWYREAIALLDRTNADAQARARLLDAYAASTLGTTTYEETSKAHEDAIRAYEQVGMQPEAAAVGARLAQVAFESSSEDVLPRVENALARLEKLGESEALATTLHVLGWTHWRLGHYDIAEPHLRRAAEIAGRVGAPVAQGQALQTLGVLLVDRNRWREGLDLLEKSYVVAQEVRSLDLLLRVCHNLPNVLGHYAPGEDGAYGRTGMDRAHEILQEGIDLARRAGNRRWESGLLGIKAWVLKNSGELDLAERCAVESLQSAREIDSSSLIGEHLLDVALIKLDRGEVGAAEPYYTEALSILRGHPEPGNEVWLGVAAAQISQAHGDETGAVRVLLDTVDQLGDNLSVYGGEWLLHTAVRSLLAQGHDVQARQLLQEKKGCLIGRPVSEAALAWCEALLDPDPHRRADRLRQVAHTFHSFGWRFDEARCLLDLADAMTAAGHDGETVRQEGVAILSECRAALPA